MRVTKRLRVAKQESKKTREKSSDDSVFTADRS